MQFLDTSLCCFLLVALQCATAQLLDEPEKMEVVDDPLFDPDSSSDSKAARSSIAEKGGTSSVIDEATIDHSNMRRGGSGIPRYVSRKQKFTKSDFISFFTRNVRDDIPAQVVRRDSHGDMHRVILGHCSMTEKCKKGQYCDGTYCFQCKDEGDHCDLNGECCEGSECQYGVCEKGVKAGMPGTFCDLAKDCTGPNTCCIHEMSISRYHSVCKPMLEEHESCGPINLFHQDIMRAHMEPVCGPCKQGLACKGVGILGRHSICLPENEE